MEEREDNDIKHVNKPFSAKVKLKQTIFEILCSSLPFSPFHLFSNYPKNTFKDWSFSTVKRKFLTRSLTLDIGFVKNLHVLPLTWSPVSLFHPNVAVALSHTGLGVEERHSDAPLSAEPGIVVVTLLHGISVVLLSQPDTTKPDAAYSVCCG